jgi:alpha-glucosidase
VLCLPQISSAGRIVSVTSPDDRVRITASDESGDPHFNVTVDGEPFLRDCDLGLRLQGDELLGPGLKFRRVSNGMIDERDALIWGPVRQIRNHANEVSIELVPRQGGTPRMLLILRAYNDGIAFRYRVIGGGEEIGIEEELTALHFASDPRAYALPLKGFGTSYEAPYQIDELSNLDGRMLGLPITLAFENGIWAAVTEAHLDDYAGLYVKVTRPQTLVAVLSQQGGGRPAVIREAPFDTPWRVVMIGRRAGDLVESSLVLNCNPPSEIDDTSWIKPGKVIWDWWSKKMVNGVDFEGGMNTATMKHYIAFAAEAGIEYMLIDEGWSYWSNIPDEDGKLHRVTDIMRWVPALDLPEVIEYAHEKGVKIWLWLTWGHCAKQMAEAFPLYEKWGIAGVKIDFMNRDDQWMVNWYHEVAEQAAKHHLMVNMHGAYKPTGIERTWPNMMTREGLMGAEHSKWSKNVTPEHNTTLPFTRMLAGPMDYTPGGLNVSTIERFKPRDAAPFMQGTLCHQLALYVAFLSPIQTCADYPDSYRGKVGFDFLQQVPVTWDDTVVVDGIPGEFIAIARKSGDDWYIGCMTNRQPRKLQLNLDFLKAGSWAMDIWADGPRAADVPEQVRRAKREIDWADTLEVKMAPAGGYVARLREK